MKSKTEMKSLAVVTLLGGVLVALPLIANANCYDENNDIYACPSGYTCQSNWDTTTTSCITQNYYCCSSSKKIGVRGDT
jgi:hypothetical protein